MQFICSSPYKDAAQGRPVRVCPIVLYSDDTSGNRSKNGTVLMCGVYNWLLCQEVRMPN